MQTKVDIINALDTLDPEQLNKVAIYITEQRRAGWGLDVPERDERPTPVMGGDTQERLFDKPLTGIDLPYTPYDQPHAEHNRFCTEATPCGECQKIIKGYDGSTGKRVLGGE